MTFTRYAIYFAPPADAAWSVFGTQWLGWDTETGRALAHPELDGLDIAVVTETPRKYGLHGTLKPPFLLTEGQSVGALQDACAALAASHAPITLGGLEIARLGRFLALRPTGETADLADLAATCVTDLDPFRAPATQAEIDKRRGGGLPPAQDAHLLRWGYPYVMDQFKFHITLTGKLSKPLLAQVQGTLETHLAPLLPTPFEINDLALMGEAEDGRFHLIHRYALSG